MEPLGGRAQPEAEPDQELFEQLDAALVRRLVHAVDGGSFAIREKERDGFVREEHELLDDAMGDVALGRADVDDSAFVIEHDLRLGPVEVDRAPRLAPGAKDLEESFHPFESRKQIPVLAEERRRAVDENSFYFGIGHPGSAPDDPIGEAARDHLPRRAHLDENALHEAIDTGIQAADSVREPLGEHGDGPLGKVDRGPPVKRFLVEARAFAHVVRDVRDMDPEEIVSVLEDLDLDRIVEVPRRLPVDGDDWSFAEVFSASESARIDLGRNGLCFRQNVFGELVGKSVLRDDDQKIHSGFVDVPDDFDDPSERRAVRCGITGELDDHHVLGLRAAQILVGEEDFVWKPRVEWDDAGPAGVRLEPPHDMCRDPLDDFDDSPLEPSPRRSSSRRARGRGRREARPRAPSRERRRPRARAPWE